MSTTSTYFGFVIATTSDTVSVVTQIAGNFVSVDSLLSVAHTGTGELKSGLALNAATLQSPVLSGTLAGGDIVATTGAFQTITATGGSLSVGTFSLGTYSFPATLGASGEILTVSGAGIVFAANAPGTGASTALDNLDSVAINTSLNNFTAGTITVATMTGGAVIGTGGTLTAFGSVNATTGTFSSGLRVAGTMLADAVSATGGALTAGTLSVGTYSYPGTVGSTHQMLMVTSGNALVFKSGAAYACPVLEWHGAVGSGTAGGLLVMFGAPTGSNLDTASGGSAFAFSREVQEIVFATSQFYKGAAISTLSVYARMFASSTTGSRHILNVTIATTVYSVPITATVPTIYSTTFNLAALPNGSFHNLVAALQTVNGTARAALSDLVMLPVP